MSAASVTMMLLSAVAAARLVSSRIFLMRPRSTVRWTPTKPLLNLNGKMLIKKYLVNISLRGVMASTSISKIEGLGSIPSGAAIKIIRAID